MAGGNRSKAKGNGAERELAKILSEVFEGSFVRVPNSGAFTGGKNFTRRSVLSDTQNRIYRGDIIPPDHMPRLVVESKFYAEFPYHALLTEGTIPLLETWIGQSLDAVEPGDFWFIAFKVNRKFWSIALHDSFANQMLYSHLNHAKYLDGHGRSFVVTELKRFLLVNKNPILNLCAAPV